MSAPATAVDEEMIANFQAFRPLPVVQGIEYNGAVYPLGPRLPDLEDRHLMWNGAGLPPTETPFQIELAADFDFKYVWGNNGSDWARIQNGDFFQNGLRLAWGYKHAIPDGNPFFGDVPEGSLAKVLASWPLATT